MSTGTKLAFSDAVLRVAGDRDLCVVRWADSPGPQHFDAVLAAVRERAQQGQPVSLLNVVDAPGKLPRFDEAVRSAARRMSEGMTPHMRAVAHVILLEGFAGATVRMFVSTLTLLSRSSAPTKVFAELDEGRRWLSEQAGRRDTDGRLAALYGTVVAGA